MAYRCVTSESFVTRITFNPMTRGRHRHQLSALKVVPVAALGLIATAGVALAVVSGDTVVLQFAVVASWLIALAIAADSFRRSRGHAREITLVESAQRREQTQFGERLTALGTSIAALQTQLERLNDESASLRLEVLQLRAERAENEEIVRAARVERARAQQAERDAADQRLLTAAAFEAAAKVLESFNAGDAPEQDWISSWIESLSASTDLDLTMHDDTIALDLSALPVLDAHLTFEGGAAADLPLLSIVDAFAAAGIVEDDEPTETLPVLQAEADSGEQSVAETDEDAETRAA